MPKSLLILFPASLVIDRVTITPDHVLIAVRACARVAACPLCRRRSRRVHSRYVRHFSDLPWQGRLSRFDLQVRRFRCSDPECLRRIFAERLSAVALPRVRHTVRLTDAQHRIALSAGGEGGARLAHALAMPVSGDTMLRLIRASPLPEAPSPRVVGINDWAWRRGQRYGTLIVDLERARPLDLLPDRDAQTVANWLRCHPSIAVVARDRAGAYADGVRTGALGAVQVADRWHLLRNLGDALARALDRHGRDMRTAAGAVHDASIVPAAPTLPPAAVQQAAPNRYAVRRARFSESLSLHAQGWTARRIARAVGVNRQNVQGWLRSGELPTWQQRRQGSSVDRHADHLNRRWDNGCRNAAQLWREIQDQNFHGRLRTVQRWFRQRRDAAPAMTNTDRVAPWPTPSRQRASWLAVAEPERLDNKGRHFVDALLARSPELADLASLALSCCRFRGHAA